VVPLLEGKIFKLTRNIIFDNTTTGDTITLDGIEEDNNYSNFIPIGGVKKTALSTPMTINGHTANYYYPADNDDKYSFRGTLDGGGYHISNLYVVRSVLNCQMIDTTHPNPITSVSASTTDNKNMLVIKYVIVDYLED
jgi:hypothetical protein